MPRVVLLDRLEVMWSNTIRVRTLCILAFGYDPEAWGFDQKPFRTNERGSKSAPTLAHRSDFIIPLKEVHSETRARWTVCTVVVSNLACALAGPPAECMFKGGEIIAAELRDAAEACALAGLRRKPATLAATASSTS